MHWTVFQVVPHGKYEVFSDVVPAEEDSVKASSFRQTCFMGPLLILTYIVNAALLLNASAVYSPGMEFSIILRGFAPVMETPQDFWEFPRPHRRR